MGNKNSTKMFVWIAILAIVVLLVGFGGGFFKLPSTTATTTTPNTPSVCSSETTPDLTINAFDVDNPGTSIAETSVYRKTGATGWTVFTTGTAITGLEPGEEYEFVPGITTATAEQIDNAYGEYLKHTVLCKETEVIEIAMANDELEANLGATFYNKDGDASSQTYTVGDVYTVSIVLKAGKDEYFGNPMVDMPNILVLKMNRTEMERPVEVYLDDGTELKAIAVPECYTGQATAFTEYAYELPSIGDRELEVFMSLEADDTNAPSVDGNAYIFAGGYYIDDQGAVQYGACDDNGVAVGASDPDTVALDFTA